MAIRTYKVTLDSKNTIAPEPVFLRQGDKTGAVVIDATLMDNGSPVSLSGLVPMFKANTADGQAVIADSTGFNIVNASGGEFNYQVPNALSAVPGKITTAYFSFSDSSGSESTFDVAFIIKKAVDITKPQADEYITIIDGTLQSLQQKIDAMNTDVQTILNAFNQGDFYNKTQTDSKDADTLASAKSYADTQDANLATDINVVADGLNVWHKLVTLNGFTSTAFYRVSGGLLELQGFVKAPTGTNGQAIQLFAAPVNLASGQYYLSTAPEGNGGSGSTPADIFPDSNTIVKIWHAKAEKSYSLNGISLLTEAAASDAK